MKSNYTIKDKSEVITFLELDHQINENSIESLTNQLDNIFRNSKSLSPIDYQLFVCYIERLKIRYFLTNHQSASKIKDISFKAFVDSLR